MTLARSAVLSIALATSSCDCGELPALSCKVDADCGAGDTCTSQIKWGFFNLKKMPKNGSMAPPSPETTTNLPPPTP